MRSPLARTLSSPLSSSLSSSVLCISLPLYFSYSLTPSRALFFPNRPSLSLFSPFSRPSSLLSLCPVAPLPLPLSPSFPWAPCNVLIAFSNKDLPMSDGRHNEGLWAIIDTICGSRLPKGTQLQAYHCGMPHSDCNSTGNDSTPILLLHLFPGHIPQSTTFYVANKISCRSIRLDNVRERLRDNLLGVTY